MMGTARSARGGCDVFWVSVLERLGQSGGVGEGGRGMQKGKKKKDR